MILSLKHSITSTLSEGNDSVPNICPRCSADQYLPPGALQTRCIGSPTESGQPSRKSRNSFSTLSSNSRSFKHPTLTLNSNVNPVLQSEIKELARVTAMTHATYPNEMYTVPSYFQRYLHKPSRNIPPCSSQNQDWDWAACPGLDSESGAMLNKVLDCLDHGAIMETLRACVLHPEYRIPKTSYSACASHPEYRFLMLQAPAIASAHRFLGIPEPLSTKCLMSMVVRIFLSAVPFDSGFKCGISCKPCTLQNLSSRTLFHCHTSGR